MTIPSRRS